MRLWTIDPIYLDTKGLVAAWREGLLAKKVLEGKTSGYKNHPQLVRFFERDDPIVMITKYLNEIYKEAKKRRFKFNYSKISNVIVNTNEMISTSNKQIEYEFELLKSKLEKRDLKKLNEIKDEVIIKINRTFKRRIGTIENWERVIPNIVKRMKME
jgi:Pyrimidine dimer DNA glycosylase